MEVTFSSAQGGTWGQPLAAWRATGRTGQPFETERARKYLNFTKNIENHRKLIGGLEHEWIIFPYIGKNNLNWLI